MNRGIAVAVVLGLCLTLSAHAAPPNHPPEGPASPVYSITLNQTDPVLDSWVSFSYVLPTQLSDNCYPNGKETNNCGRISLRCYQPVPFEWTDPSGIIRTQVNPWVYGDGSQALNNAFLLGGGGSVWYWHGGEAYCVATLYRWRGQSTSDGDRVIYAETSFVAAGQ